MSEVLRGRELRPRVTRKPSPGLAARMKMLEADAEKRRNGILGDAAATAKMEIARSGPKNKDGFSSDNLTVVDEGMEVGGARSNGIGGCNGGAITSIIHTYNSQPAALTATLLLTPPTNGAVKTKISDEGLVAIATEDSSSVQDKIPSSQKPELLEPITKEISILLTTTEEEPTPADDVVTTYVAAEPVTDEHDTEGNTPQEDTNNTSAQQKDHQQTDKPTEPEPEHKQGETHNELSELQSEPEGQAEEETRIIPKEETPKVPVVKDDKVEGVQEQIAEETKDTKQIPEPIIIETPPPAIYTRDYELSKMESLERPITPESPESYRPQTANSTSESMINGSYFDPTPYSTSNGLSRRASVFSLSRISFSAQLSRLTSLALPLSSEFSERIKRMETSAEVSNAITESARQILRWIDTAKTVLKGLDSEDDVEWAAQGKRSLNDVDVAVGKFSNLMKVYVAAIDELQERSDAQNVGGDIFKEVVETMEVILDGWNEVQQLLRGVKGQVETAMEWNELWTTILQDIQAEIEACQTIVFEIEERRHRSLMEESVANSGMDIDALATIVEDSPQKVSGQPPSEEDASLLRLFARMQPLRASLDFLPMRLASFQARADSVFPSACEELGSRRRSLEKKWKKLNDDAEEMKRELGEDKWVAIFRNAGKQATHMIDSVDRSLKKLKDAVNHFKDGYDLSMDSGIHKKVEAYEAKRVHYGPAIQRVLAIIDKGVSDRLTVNGEILRLHAAMHKRWKHMEQEMAITDEVLHELNLHASQQALRDSVSTIMSMDARSPNSMVHTPGSSPASSIVLSSPANTAKSSATVHRRSESAAGQYAKVSRGALGPGSATSGAPRPKHPPGRMSSATVSNILSPTSSRGASPSPNSQRMSVYHTPSSGTPRRPSGASTRSTSSLDNRPRWNISVNTSDLDTGHQFKPLSLTTPSEHRRSPRSHTLSTPGPKTRIPIPSPLRYGPTPGQSPSLNPIMSSPTYKYSGNTGSKRASIYGASGFLKSPLASPRSVSGTSSHGGLDVPYRPELRSQQSMSNLAGMYNNGRRSSMSSNQGDDQISNATTSAVRHVTRPASAMASGRRTSMLPSRARSPTTTTGTPNGTSGREPTSSIASGRVSRAKRMSMPPKPMTQQAQDQRPKWK